MRCTRPRRSGSRLDELLTSAASRSRRAAPERGKLFLPAGSTELQGLVSAQNPEPTPEQIQQTRLGRRPVGWRIVEPKVG